MAGAVSIVRCRSTRVLIIIAVRGQIFDQSTRTAQVSDGRRDCAAGIFANQVPAVINVVDDWVAADGTADLSVEAIVFEARGSAFGRAEQSILGVVGITRTINADGEIAFCVISRRACVARSILIEIIGRISDGGAVSGEGGAIAVGIIVDRLRPGICRVWVGNIEQDRGRLIIQVVAKYIAAGAITLGPLAIADRVVSVIEGASRTNKCMSDVTHAIEGIIGVSAAGGVVRRARCQVDIGVITVSGDGPSARVIYKCFQLIAPSVIVAEGLGVAGILD